LPPASAVTGLAIEEAEMPGIAALAIGNTPAAAPKQKLLECLHRWGRTRRLQKEKLIDNAASFATRQFRRLNGIDVLNGARRFLKRFTRFFGKFSDIMLRDFSPDFPAI